MRIEIFESMNYGIRGLTDTSKDIKAEKFYQDLNKLKSQYKDIEILTYKVDVYGSRPKKIDSLINIDENRLVKEISNKKLPIIFINDEFFKYGSYPTIEEIREYMQVNN
ncbi:TPA: arsenic metallochaperone ArsD family protein [Clostridioides difficile]